MNKKLFMLITGVVGGVQAIGVALVTYFQPAYSTAINACIVLVGTCIVDCAANFVDEQK